MSPNISARSLARMYAATVSEVDGLRLLSPATVSTMTTPQPAKAHGVPQELEAFFAEARRVVLFHHDPQHSDRELESLLEHACEVAERDDLVLAREGMEITL